MKSRSKNISEKELFVKKGFFSVRNNVKHKSPKNFISSKKKEKTMKLTFSVKLLPLTLMAYEWNAAKGS